MICLIKFVIILFNLNIVLTISNHHINQTAEILWNLSNVAISGRQNSQNPYYYNYHRKYPSYYQNYLSQYQYGMYRPHNINLYRPPKSPFANLIPTRETFMDALDSVAKNDDLQCVPKLLCEVTSGTVSGRQNSIQLPFNVNMESFIGLLSAINSGNVSPLLHFGKAALLGYTSKGDSHNCNSAYPNCPSDPDKLVQYLNNHNGGFFRFFNGLNRQTYAPNNYYKNHQAQERIQTKPSTSHSYYENVLKFPQDYNKYSEREPKKFIYDKFKFYNDEELDIQKPLPNHKANAMIFPDRTGTGNLRLDPEELKDDNRQSFSFENNNIIRFNPDLVNDAFYYKNIFGQKYTNER